MPTEAPVVKLSEPIEVDFQPTTKEQKVVSETHTLFRRCAESRNKSFEYFDGDDLISYIENSVRAFYTNISERENIEDWQATVHDQFTRNKVLAVLGKMMNILPMAEFVGRGDEDHSKGVLITNLYEYTEELDEYDEFMTHYLLEAIVKGTAIGYEGVNYNRKVRRTVSGSGDNIKEKKDVETVTEFYASIVPLEDFYPASVSIRKVKDQPYCFWRTIYTYTKFEEQYKSYKKSKFVEAKRTFEGDEPRPFFVDYISDDVKDGEVEVIRFYDKLNDQFIIIANGVWINPMGKEIVSPLPFNHKELPFFDVKFDFFGDFFYGKSMPDRLSQMQAVLDVLTNMFLDQSFLTIFPPILTAGFDAIEDDFLRPGRRIAIDTQGLPLNQAYQELKMSTPNGWHQFLLEYTRKIMEESSLDRVSQGQAGVGDRTTAQEIRAAAEGVLSILQLFARMINNAVRRKAVLRAKNILQFGFDPKSPMIRRVLSESAAEDMNSAFNVFKINDAVLSGGKRGTKIIEIYKNKASLPTKNTLKARALIAKKKTKSEVEIVALEPAYVRNYEFDVKTIPNPKRPDTKEVEKALQLEKVTIYQNFPPGIIDFTELAIQTAEKLGDDPSKVVNQDVFNPIPAGQSSQGATGNNVSNQTRSIRGGEQGAAELANL